MIKIYLLASALVLATAHPPGAIDTIFSTTSYAERPDGKMCPEYYRPVIARMPDGTVRQFTNACFAEVAGGIVISDGGEWKPMGPSTSSSYTPPSR